MSSIELQTLPRAVLSRSTSNEIDPPSYQRTKSPSPDRASLSLNPGSQLAPVDRGRAAWTFLFCGTVCETLVWGLPFSVGVLHNYWTTELFPGLEGAEKSLTLAATLQTGLMYCFAVPVGPLFQLYPQHRFKLQLFGLICASVGLIGSAFATAPIHILVCLGLIYPMAVLYYTPAAIFIFQWFVERRGIASGILYAGTGLGGCVFPFLMDGLLKRFGYKASMIALGVGYFAIGFGSLFGIKERLPIARNRGTARHAVRYDVSFFKSSPIWAFLTCIIFISLGNFVPSVWIPTYVQDLGIKPDGAVLIALMNAASIPGLLALGYLSDHLPIRLVIALSCFGSAAACAFAWGFGTTAAPLIVFVLIFGFLSLSFTAVWTKLISIVSKDNPALPPLIFSLFALARGIGNISSGPISSWLLQSTLFHGASGAYGVKNYGALLLWSGVTMFAGSIAGLVFWD